MNLNYKFSEKLNVQKPVDRIPYLVGLSRKRVVLDIGCYDETALFKQETGHWLHSELIKSARQVIGIDNSSKIPESRPEGGNDSIILKLSADDIDNNTLKKYDFDLIVAGELIEHLDNTLGFFKKVKQLFNNKQFICTTPNSASLYNVLLSIFKRESTHRDHLQVYSYKTLNTLCAKAGFQEWDIIPYHARFTESIHDNRRFMRQLFIFVEKMFNITESIFPMLSGGLILHVKKL
jgi:Methyltransferase domain